MTIPTKLSLQFASDIDLGELKHQEHLWRFILDAMRDFPDCAEGVTEFDGIQHFITYVVKGDVIEAFVLRRDTAEAMLNDIGLSTVEPGLPPWPGSEH